MFKSYFSLCTSGLFWLKECLMHPRLGRAWKESGGYDSLSRGELDSVVERKLSGLLRHAAKTVPFYMKWFLEHDLDADHPKLEDFPILSKPDIRGREDEFISRGFPRRELRLSHTSGSTGEPFAFYKTKADIDYTYANLWRGMLRFGIRPGMKRVLIQGFDDKPVLSAYAKTKRAIKGWLNKCLEIDAHFLALTDANVELALKKILRYRPDYIHGYVSSIYLLARYASEHGIDVSALKLVAVVTESEKCYPFQREMIERVFGSQVIEYYGSVEFGMIAQPAKDGRFCINEDHVYVETTPDGDAVFTNLDAWGWTLIRFKNGDMLKLGDKHPQLPYRTIQEIDGRKTELVYLPQGGALQGFIVMHPLYKHSQYLKAYQIHQTDITHLTIKMALACKMPEEVLRRIVLEMQTLVGNLMDVKVQFVDDIPVSRAGKRLFVLSDVQMLK